MLIWYFSRSLMSTCNFFNKPMVEDVFIGVIVRSLDTMNFVFFFINPIPYPDEVPDLIFGLLGYRLTAFSPAIGNLEIDLATLQLE